MKKAGGVGGSVLLGVGCALAVAVPSLVFDGDASAGQPERASVWTECAANSKTPVLHVRLQQVVSQRQLVLRLWGDALNPPRLPFDIQLPRVAADALPGGSGIGDARWCPAAGQSGGCEAVAVTATIYVIGVADGAEVQGQVMSMGGVPVDPAHRAVFVGWVRAGDACR